MDEKVVMIALQQGIMDVYFKMLLAMHSLEIMLKLQDTTNKYIYIKENMKKHPSPGGGKEITRKGRAIKKMMPMISCWVVSAQLSHRVDNIKLSCI